MKDYGSTQAKWPSSVKHMMKLV